MPPLFVVSPSAADRNRAERLSFLGALEPFMQAKKILCASALVAAILVPSVVFADGAPLPMIGIGVSVPSSGTPGGAIYVPINLMPQFRLEPTIGLGNGSTAKTKESKTETDKLSAVSLGIGAFYMMHPDEKMAFYAGARLGVVMNSASSSDGTTTIESKHTDMVVALAVGGEHFLVPKFSLGAEVDLGYVSVGDTTTTITPPPTKAATPATVVQSAMSTFGSFFARFYF